MHKDNNDSFPIFLDPLSSASGFLSGPHVYNEQTENSGSKDLANLRGSQFQHPEPDRNFATGGPSLIISSARDSVGESHLWLKQYPSMGLVISVLLEEKLAICKS